MSDINDKSIHKNMTSLDIAKLVGVRHCSIKRTIERLVEKRLIEMPRKTSFKNHLCQNVTSYSFNEIKKNDALKVVAFVCPEVIANIIDRISNQESAGDYAKRLRNIADRLDADENMLGKYRAE